MGVREGRHFFCSRHRHGTKSRSLGMPCSELGRHVCLFATEVQAASCLPGSR